MIHIELPISIGSGVASIVVSAHLVLKP
jgi:hypothetical protein